MTLMLTFVWLWLMDSHDLEKSPAYVCICMEWDFSDQWVLHKRPSTLRKYQTNQMGISTSASDPPATVKGQFGNKPNWPLVLD